MLNKLLELLFKIVFWLCGIISSVILYPIYLLLSSLLDNFPDYITSFNLFLNNNLLPIVPFCRNVFVNCTGLPSELFNALITLFLSRLALRLIIIPIKFLIKVYYIIRGSSVSSSS